METHTANAHQDTPAQHARAETLACPIHARMVANALTKMEILTVSVHQAIQVLLAPVVTRAHRTLVKMEVNA